MYVLKRALRMDGTRVGDIIPLTQIRMPVDLVPVFGASADCRLTAQNSLACSYSFHLNKYVDKESYAMLDS